MIDAATFKVLLDGPAEQPALSFPAYARAFADIITHSPPQFAIAVFGDSGSGKTTLMRAIERDLNRPDPAVGSRPDVVTVWFNAWRYEREPHLIVPMLDTLREALVEWAANRAQAEGASSARKAATKVGRAARALLAGFSLTARLPLGLADFEASFDPQKVMQRLGPDAELADHGSSFYHASFNEMKSAMKEFADEGARSGCGTNRFRRRCCDTSAARRSRCSTWISSHTSRAPRSPARPSRVCSRRRARSPSSCDKWTNSKRPARRQ